VALLIPLIFILLFAFCNLLYATSFYFECSSAKASLAQTKFFIITVMHDLHAGKQFFE